MTAPQTDFTDAQLRRVLGQRYPTPEKREARVRYLVAKQHALLATLGWLDCQIRQLTGGRRER